MNRGFAGPPRTGCSRPRPWPNRRVTPDADNWNNPGLYAFYLTPPRRLPVPNTLQYPLERHRDVQRRWQQILQRTAAPRTIPPVGLKISALSSTHGKVESSGRNSPPRSRPDSTANVGRIRNG